MLKLPPLAEPSPRGRLPARTPARARLSLRRGGVAPPNPGCPARGAGSTTALRSDRSWKAAAGAGAGRGRRAPLARGARGSRRPQDSAGGACLSFPALRAGQGSVPGAWWPGPARGSSGVTLAARSRRARLHRSRAASPACPPARPLRRGGRPEPAGSAALPPALQPRVRCGRLLLPAPPSPLPPCGVPRAAGASSRTQASWLAAPWGGGDNWKGWGRAPWSLGGG